MADTILTIAGAALLAGALGYYAYACKDIPFPSMGADTTFAPVWLAGSIALSLGVLPLAGLSRWWTVLTAAVLFALSFPLRSAVARTVCVPVKDEPSGFQKFAAREKEAAEKP